MDVTTIASDQLTVTVSPLGAEMQSLTSRDGRNWLWNGDPAFWAGRSPILFPIVGKAPGNRIGIDGQSYEMNQHGIARRSTFTLADASAQSCRYELAASDATRAAYPFEFHLSVTHAVEGATLRVTAEVENRDAQPLPFGLGLHPAFIWPLPGAEGKPHVVTLEDGREPQLSLLQDGLRLPTLAASPFKQGRLVLDHPMFDNDALIFPEGAGDRLTYAAEGGPALRFRFDNLPNLALWSKPGQAPFLCVEPWHGTAPFIDSGDDIRARPGTIELAPGGKARFGFSVEVPA